MRADINDESSIAAVVASTLAIVNAVSLYVLAYNLKGAIAVLGAPALIHK